MKKFSIHSKIEDFQFSHAVGNCQNHRILTQQKTEFFAGYVSSAPKQSFEGLEIHKNFEEIFEEMISLVTCL